MGSQDEEATEPLYRSARPVPFELIQHCGIFLEEKLCQFLPESKALTATNYGMIALY